MSQCTWTQNLLQFGVVLALPVIPTDGECSSTMVVRMTMSSVLANDAPCSTLAAAALLATEHSNMWMSMWRIALSS
jgi:hypothetical protein